MPRKVSSWSNSLNFINLFVMNWLINHCDITNQLINLWITSTNVNLIDHLATSPSTIGGGRGHLEGASRGVPGDLLRCHHGLPSKRAPVKENGSDNTHGAPDITFALITSCVWWSCQHKKLSFACLHLNEEFLRTNQPLRFSGPTAYHAARYQTKARSGSILIFPIKLNEKRAMALIDGNMTTSHQCKDGERCGKVMIGEIENPTKRPKTHYVTSAGTPGCQPPPFLKSPFLLSLHKRLPCIRISARDWKTCWHW